MTRDERLARLEHNLALQSNLCDDLLAQIAELNLKMRFALSLMRVRKQSTATIIDPTSGAPKLELMDGYVAYMRGGRDMMMRVIDDEIAAMEAEEAAAYAKESETTQAAPGTAGASAAVPCEADRGSSADEDADAAPAGPRETRH